MKGIVSLLYFFLLLGPALTAQAQQKQLKYYRIDTVKTVKGEIAAVKNEPCYNKKNFIVIYLKEKESGETYRVEVSPQWYFSMDLMIGSRIEVTGSFSQANGINQIMTRSIMFQGELFRFRDKSGFPLWRKKGMGQDRSRTGKHKTRHRGPH
jgi:hypothetical protein